MGEFDHKQGEIESPCRQAATATSRPSGPNSNSVALGFETPAAEREFLIENLLVRTHCIIGRIWWTGLAPWEFEFPFPGSRISTF